MKKIININKIKHYQNYQKSLPSAKSSVAELFSVKPSRCEEKAMDEIKKAEAGLKNMGFNSDGIPITKRPKSSLLPRVRRTRRVHPEPDPATQSASHSTPPKGGNNKCVSKSTISYKDVELKYSPNLNQLEVIFKNEDTLNIKLRGGAKSLPLINFFNYRPGAQRYEKGEFKSLISVKKDKDKYRDHSDGLPVGLILANLIYYLSKKLSPDPNKKFNIHVPNDKHNTSNPDLVHCFPGQTSYFKSLGFTNTPETKEAVTWTGFTEKDIIERIDAIFTSKLDDEDKDRIMLLVSDESSTHGRKKNKRGSKKGKKINGSPRKRKRSNKKPKKKINKNH